MPEVYRLKMRCTLDHGIPRSPCLKEASIAKFLGRIARAEKFSLGWNSEFRKMYACLSDGDAPSQQCRTYLKIVEPS